MIEKEKPLSWLNGEIRTPPFSSEARVAAGTYLRQLQKGWNLSMPQSRPMPSIGARCYELRIKDTDIVWRIIYRIDKEAILIVEIFKKKTKETPRYVIDACKARLRQYDGNLES